MLENTCKFIATCLGIGNSKVAPGTMGSIVGLLIYRLAGKYSLPVTACSILLGFLTSGKAEAEFGRQDAREIVIDETAGMMLALALAQPSSLFAVLISFLSFRLFDVLKPFPIRRLQDLRGAAGIMLDDIGAAIYSQAALYAGRYILGLVA